MDRRSRPPAAGPAISGHAAARPELPCRAAHHPRRPSRAAHPRAGRRSPRVARRVAGGRVVKARNVSKGDWITVGGRPVKVTKVQAGGFWGMAGWVDGVNIEYKGGSKS